MNAHLLLKGFFFSVLKFYSSPYNNQQINIPNTDLLLFYNIFTNSEAVVNRGSP